MRGNDANQAVPGFWPLVGSLAFAVLVGMGLIIAVGLWLWSVAEAVAHAVRGVGQ